MWQLLELARLQRTMLRSVVTNARSPPMPAATTFAHLGTRNCRPDARQADHDPTATRPAGAQVHLSPPSRWQKVCYFSHGDSHGQGRSWSLVMVNVSPDQSWSRLWSWSLYWSWSWSAMVTESVKTAGVELVVTMVVVMVKHGYRHVVK